MKNYIQNPILKGFNPDPSICRVGNDFYIATSTFEWFPGVQIHHSKDLINWEVISQPLQRKSQLDMKGIPDSCGVWAPCLSFNDGVFYLVFTNVKSFDGVWKDTPNFVVKTSDIYGKWSEPIYLNSTGFDGSFFHDKGKTWYTCMRVDHRKGKFFGGIELQEYSLENEKLIGEVNYLTTGTKLGATEGPHLYRQNGYYYLILAEGGTEYGHASTILRSKYIEGPYKEHPHNPILSCKDVPSHPLQKSGHASMVELKDGRWLIVFLVGRPLSTHGRCVLGRETAIEEIIWENHWPYLKSRSEVPRIQIESPLNIELTLNNRDIDKSYNFDNNVLHSDFQSLRIPTDETWISLKERPGYLRLKGKESLTSTHTQALVARRLQHFNAEISTVIEFSPETFQNLAGLIVYYNTGHFHYLHMTKKDNHNILSVISSNNFEMVDQEEIVMLGDTTNVYLKAEIHGEKLRFKYSLDNKSYFTIGEILDMSILSDDNVREGSDRYRPAFTGCFVGLCCQDLRRNELHADFDWFTYKELYETNF